MTTRTSALEALETAARDLVHSYNLRDVRDFTRSWHQLFCNLRDALARLDAAIGERDEIDIQD